MADGIQWDDEEQAPGGIVWDDEPAAAPPPSSDSAGDWLKRGANAVIRASTMPLGPLALAAPQFDVAPMEATSGAGSFARGAQQGASFGFADEEAGVRGALNDVMQGDASPEELVKRYVIARQAERGADDRAKELNKAAFVGGEIAGGVAVPLPGAGLRAATTAGKFGQAAKLGAGMGAAHGLGNSEADLTEGEVGGALADTAVGAVAGAAGGAIGEGIAQGVSKVVVPGIQKAAAAASDALSETAAMRALKAAGYIGKDLKAQFRRDATPLLERGQALLDEGVVTAGATLDDVAERAAAAKDVFGSAIGKALDAADQLGAKFDVRPFVAKARQELLDPIKNDPAMAAEASRLAQLLDAYEKLPLGSIGFKEANQMKSNLQQQINWGNRWNDAKAVPHNDNLMALQRLFLNEVDDQLGAAFGSKLGGAGARIRDVFKQIKQRYGHMTDAADKARMGQARELGNAPVSMRDYMAAIAGAAASVGTGDITPLLIAGGGAAINKLARARGDQVVAAGANNLAKRLASIAQSNPQLLGKYGPTLQKAAMAGERELATAHFVLSQRDPGYRQQMQPLLSGEQNPDEYAAR